MSSHQILRGGLVSMSVRVCGLGLAFLSQILLSRMLGASQYGSYVIALGWAMVLAILARLGLDNSALRFATIYREEGRAADFRGLVAFSLTAISGLSFLIAAVLLTAKHIGLVPLQPIDWPLIMGVASLVLGSALLGWLSILIRTANRIFASQFYEQVLRPTLLIFAVAATVLAGRALDASRAMILTSATVAIATVGIAFHVRTAFSSVAPARPSFEHRREWLSVSWVLFLIAAIQEVLNQIDLILLGILGNATQAAHFAAAWRVASLVPFGLVAMATVSGPLIASAHNRGDLGELARIARVNARFSTLFAVILAVLLAIAGRTLLGLFGPGFDGAFPALLILLGGGLVNSFTGSVGYYLILTGHQKGALAIILVALALSATLNILLIPRFGAVGSAIASASALSFWNLAMLIYARRAIGIDASAIGAPVRPRS